MNGEHRKRNWVKKTAITLGGEGLITKGLFLGGKCEQKCFIKQVTVGDLLWCVSTQVSKARDYSPGAHSKWRQQQTDHMVQLVSKSATEECTKDCGKPERDSNSTGAFQGCKGETRSQRFTRWSSPAHSGEGEEEKGSQHFRLTFRNMIRRHSGRPSRHSTQGAQRRVRFDDLQLACRQVLKGLK